MKTIVITGANTGIGLASAKALVKSNHIVAICRNEAKGQKAVEEIQALNPQARVELEIADLANLPAVAQAADRLLARYDSIEVLLNNAGFFPSSIRYIDNIEETFYASHLGHMLLTLKLLPSLENSGQGRVINVSSGIHPVGRADRFFRQPSSYSTFQAYGDAKLANILFTMALQRHADQLSCFSLHPGAVGTEFDRNIRGFFRLLISLAKPFFLLSPEDGAKTSIYLCSAPIEEIQPYKGRYFDKSKPAPVRNADANPEKAAWLWEKSMDYLKPLLS